MPAAGPYGIEQFDAPGIINAYQVAQHNRIQMMVLQKQQQKLDREAETRDGIQRAVRAYSGGGDTAAAAPVASASAPAAPATSAAPAPRHDAGDREKLFSSLMVLDPQVAGQYMDAFSKMDKAKLDQFSERNNGIMQVAAGLMQLDPAQRKAALQQAAPELRKYGFTDEQIAGFDPSDQNLRQLVVGHMDAEKIAQFVKPNYTNVSGEVIDENALARGDKDPVRYRSEYIDTPEGLARRPGGGTAPPTLTDADIEQLERGGPTASPSGPFP